jgi:hypothetical protein
MHELFDLAADPWELRNIYNATKAADPALVAMLDGYAMAGWHCRGATCN